MAFKMNNPMKKNFGSALKSNKFLGELAAARKKGDKTFNVGGKTFNVEGSATPKLKENAPMMRMDASAMKAMGKPAPVKAMDKSPMKDGGIIQGFKDYASTLLGKDTSEQRQKQDAQKQAFIANWKNMTQEQKDKVPSNIKEKFGVN